MDWLQTEAVRIPVWIRPADEKATSIVDPVERAAQVSLAGLSTLCTPQGPLNVAKQQREWAAGAHLTA